MLTVLTLHRVTTPSSLAILANALKTLVYPLRSSGGSLRESQSVTFTLVHHITLGPSNWYTSHYARGYQYTTVQIALRVHNDGLFIEVYSHNAGPYPFLREMQFIYHAYHMHIYIIAD